MKRIALFLAAAAATLASCVKENTLAPEQTSDNLVTIKALATKTTLDGNAVVWEQDDEIAVVLEGVENAVNFEIDGEVNGASAKFVGTIAPETEYNSAYAVYPATAYTVEAGGAKITHSLPETQTGVVTSGMILSSALLDAGQLKAGNATASFHNALALVKVVVPAGVQSVSLTSDMTSGSLVGSSTFNTPDEDGVLIKTNEILTRRTVTLSTGSELEAGTYDLLVYPGTAHTLTLTMVGTDGAEYTSAVSEICFNAGEYRTIDLTKIFKVATDDLHVVLPAGGTIEVPVMTTDAYEYEVSMSAGADDWVSYVLPTKGFHKETITFTIAENTTGADREANVTITWADSKTKTFTIQQNNVYMDFVTDVNGDPIQWEETFGLYGDEALSNELTSFTNVFTIALSDDFSKGTYKISNMFKVDSYWNNGQQVTNKGGEYYANYDADNGELTVLKANSASGYTFTGNVVLAYDAVNKTFSAERIQATLLYGSSYYNSGATRYLGNYAAAVKVETPGASFDVSSLYGTYNESVKAPYSYGSTETLVISESDNPSYDLKMQFFYTSGEYSGSYETAYGKVSGDGKTITVTIPGNYSNYYGPVSDFTLTVNGNVISGSYCGMMDYSAEKPAAFDVSSLYGTYTESKAFPYADAQTLVIVESDNGSYDIKMMFSYSNGENPSSYDTAYGKVSGDGKTIAVTFTTFNVCGPLYDSTLNVNGSTISGTISSQYSGSFDYSATKQN